MNNENVRLFVRRILKQLQEGEGDAAQAERDRVKQDLLRLRRKELEMANKDLADKKNAQSSARASKDPDKRDDAEQKVKKAELEKNKAAGNVKAAVYASF